MSARSWLAEEGASGLCCTTQTYRDPRDSRLGVCATRSQDSHSWKVTLPPYPFSAAPPMCRAEQKGKCAPISQDWDNFFVGLQVSSCTKSYSWVAVCKKKKKSLDLNKNVSFFCQKCHRTHFHSIYSVTGNVVIGQEGGGQLVSSQILFFSLICKRKQDDQEKRNAVFSRSVLDKNKDMQCLFWCIVSSWICLAYPIFLLMEVGL